VTASEYHLNCLVTVSLYTHAAVLVVVFRLIFIPSDLQENVFETTEAVF